MPVGIVEPVQRLAGGFHERVAGGDVAEGAALAIGEIDAGGAGHQARITPTEYAAARR